MCAEGPQDTTGDETSLIWTPQVGSTTCFTRFHLLAHSYYIHSFFALFASHLRGALTYDARTPPPPGSHFTPLF